MPVNQLQSAAPRWQALDQYTAKQAFLAVFGYEFVPKLTSDRINFSALVFHPLFGDDWSTLELK